LKITRFSLLLREVSKLGATQAIATLSKQLESGHQDVDPNDLVFGEHGLFYLDDSGIVTRIIVHIVDKSVDHFEYHNKVAIESGDYENPDVVEKVHRYHLLNCATLRRAKSEGWRDRYKMTQKRTGKFFYRFLRDKDVFKTNENQPLHVCFHCLNGINEKHDSNTRFTRSNFSPDVFFSEEFRNHWLVDSGYQVDSETVPNCYQQDWDKISARYKQKVKYQCEGAGCRFPSLSDASMRQYLHCHHVNMDKSDNNFSNLKALCLECHAKQPNHAHMKNKNYRQYIHLVNQILTRHDNT